MSKRNVRLNVRIPVALKELMHKYVALDSHMSESDFIRDAIRQKIQHDAPLLYGELFSDRP